MGASTIVNEKKLRIKEHQNQFCFTQWKESKQYYPPKKRTMDMHQHISKSYIEKVWSSSIFKDDTKEEKNLLICGNIIKVYWKLLTSKKGICYYCHQKPKIKNKVYQKK